MAATLSSGNNSILLSITHPVEDDGITLRDDLMGVKVWYSTQQNFDPAANQGTLGYNGQNLDVAIYDLDGDVTYYVKYALISEIEPNNYVIQSAGSVKTLEGSNASLLVQVDIVSSKSDGTGYTLPTGNEILLYRDGGLVTQGITYGPATQTSNGLTATVDPTTGVITLSGTAWTSDSEAFTFTATTADGKVFSVKYTITKSKAGSEAIFIDLLRETDILASSYDGTSYEFPYTVNQIRLYKGGELITSGVTYGGTSASNGLQITVNPTTGTITAGNATNTTWTSSTETFTVTATYAGKTYTGSYTLTKNKAGRPGEDAVNPDLLSETDVVAAANDGTGYTLPSANKLTLLKGGVAVDAAQIVFRIANTSVQSQTKNGLTASISDAGIITLSGTGWSTDTEEFTFSAAYNSRTYLATYSISKSRAGTDAVIMDLLRESDVTSTSSTGSGYTFQVNKIRLYKGGLLLSTGVTYGPAEQSNNGLIASVTGNTITLTTTAGGWTSDTETFTFTATYNGVTYSKAYTIAKSKTGAKGDTGLSGDIVVQVYRRQADLPGTPDPSEQVPPTTSGGVAVAWGTTIANAPGEVWAPVYTSFGRKPTNGTMYTWEKPVRVEGKDGLKNSTGYVYYYTALPSAPDTPSASSYNFTSGTFGGLTSGWSTSVNASSPSNGYYMWASRYTVQEFIDGNGSLAQSIVFQAAVKGTNFDGVVTFTNFSNTFDSNITVIDGGKITTGSLNAKKLTIGDNTGNLASNRIVISSDNNRIEVYSAGTRRVIIGNLS